MKRPAHGRGPAATRSGSWLAVHATPEIPAPREPLLVGLFWVVATAFVGLLAYVAFGLHPIGNYSTETDFYGAYAPHAAQIQRGHIDPSAYGVVGPGYEVTLALVGFLCGNLLRAGQLISIVSAAVTLILWFQLLRRRVGARLGLIAAILLVANAQFFKYGVSATTDALALALQVGALFLLLTGAGDRAMIAAGALAGCAFLTRYNTGVLLPAGLAVLLGGGGPPRRVRAALLFAAGFLAPVAPWSAFVLAHGARFSLQLHHNIAYEVFAHARGITWDEYQARLQPQFKSLGDVIARDPGAVARRMVFNLGDHLRLDGTVLLGWPTAVAAVAGVALGWRDGTLRRLWPLWVAGALLFLSLVPVFYSERYSLALLPIEVTLAAAAFASPEFALAAGRHRRLWLKPLLVALPVAAAMRTSLAQERHILNQLPVEVLECADTLRAYRLPGDGVIARKPHIAYHAGVDAIAFPLVETLPALGRYAREHHARWIYFSWPEGVMRPAFWFLLDTTGVVPGLTPRVVTHPNPAVLYQIGPDFGTLPAWFASDTLRELHSLQARIRVHANDVELLRRYAAVLWDLGRYEDARRVLFHVDDVAPDDLNTLLLLGETMLHLGQAGQADNVFARAMAIAPRSVPARLGRGWASLLAQDGRAAAEWWRPVISLATEQETLDRMVQVYHALGDRDAEAQARAQLQRVRGR